METNPTTEERRNLTWEGFRIMAADLIVRIKAAMLEPLAEVDEKVTEAVAEVDEAMSHIPNGLTVMSESDWAETEPADQHIYMVFPDEQVESES
jgi:hypothetical protein